MWEKYDIPYICAINISPPIALQTIVLLENYKKLIN